MANKLLYPRNTSTRQVIDISGMWKFCFDKTSEGEKNGYAKGLPKTAIDMPVPASFADFFTDKYAKEYTGDFWYSTTFFADPAWKDRDVDIRFFAAAHEATVYVNGKKLGEHHGGFLPFTYNLNEVLKYGEPNVLNAVMPACDEADVNLAVHPDDPPWDIFGLPRIVGREEDYDKLFAAVPNPHNGITFCTGSLGAGRFNDLTKMAAKYAKRIYFAHLRQLKYTSDTDFYENGHMTNCGNVDVYGIVRALEENGFEGYVRPDHGRNVWGEDAKPGYGLYDRAMGACYLSGLFEAVQKDLRK